MNLLEHIRGSLLVEESDPDPLGTAALLRHARKIGLRVTCLGPDDGEVEVCGECMDPECVGCSVAQAREE